MLRTFLIIVAVVMLLGATSPSWSAQSTADVPITGESWAAAREKVLGKTPQTSSSEEYIVGHGDILGVQVYGEGDMSAGAASSSEAMAKSQAAEDSPRLMGGGVQVRIDGRASLKHIGDVEVVGLTLTQVADYLKELYSSVFENPVVTVVLLQGNSKRYTVMGKIAKPGVYYLDYPINIVQAVARSGGFAEWAKNTVTLVRNSPKTNKELFKGNKLVFDYSDFLDGEDLERNIQLQAGDIIIVN